MYSHINSKHLHFCILPWIEEAWTTTLMIARKTQTAGKNTTETPQTAWGKGEGQEMGTKGLNMPSS